MSERTTALGRAAVLLLSAAVIVKLFAAGEMVKYITPTLDPLTALAGVVLGVMGAMEAWHGLRTGPGQRAATHDAEHGHSADGSMNEALERGFIYAIVLLPLALGLVVAPRALSTSALGGEHVTRLLLTFAQGFAAAARAPKPDAPLDDVGPLLAYLRKVGDGSIGQPVRVTGLVLRSNALGTGEFALLRYAIAHCVADARPVALLVVASTSPDIQPDQWVEVDGEVASREREGDRLVTIVARRITPVEEPRNPYLSAAY
jgi:uncharacterized repeat protein (TIGR03943 family)